VEGRRLERVEGSLDIARRKFGDDFEVVEVGGDGGGVVDGLSEEISTADVDETASLLSDFLEGFQKR
jgi:hypothetical protein